MSCTSFGASMSSVGVRPHAMASDSDASDTVLSPETVQLPESDDEDRPPAAASAVGVNGFEEVASASASSSATPERLEFRRRRDKAIENLRAIYNLPDAEGKPADDVASAMMVDEGAIPART